MVCCRSRGSWLRGSFINSSTRLSCGAKFVRFVKFVIRNSLELTGSCKQVRGGSYFGHLNIIYRYIKTILAVFSSSVARRQRRSSDRLQRLRPRCRPRRSHLGTLASRSQRGRSRLATGSRWAPRSYLARRGSSVAPRFPMTFLSVAMPLPIAPVIVDSRLATVRVDTKRYLVKNCQSYEFPSAAM
jgi:hypothetical protein